MVLFIGLIVSPLALGQPHDGPRDNEVTTRHLGKYVTSIDQELFI